MQIFFDLHFVLVRSALCELVLIFMVEFLVSSFIKCFSYLRHKLVVEV